MHRGLGRRARFQRLLLDALDDVGEAVQRPRTPALDQVGPRARAHGRPTAGGVDAVQRRLQHDVEQGVAVEVGGDALADAPHGILQPGLLALELVQACFDDEHEEERQAGAKAHVRPRSMAAGPV
jgi:hypothetical protein